MALVTVWVQLGLVLVIYQAICFGAGSGLSWRSVFFQTSCVHSALLGSHTQEGNWMHKEQSLHKALIRPIRTVYTAVIIINKLLHKFQQMKSCYFVCFVSSLCRQVTSVSFILAHFCWKEISRRAQLCHLTATTSTSKQFPSPFVLKKETEGENSSSTTVRARNVPGVWSFLFWYKMHTQIMYTSVKFMYHRNTALGVGTNVWSYDYHFSI